MRVTKMLMEQEGKRLKDLGGVYLLWMQELLGLKVIIVVFGLVCYRW